MTEPMTNERPAELRERIEYLEAEVVRLTLLVAGVTPAQSGPAVKGCVFHDVSGGGIEVSDLCQFDECTFTH